MQTHRSRAAKRDLLPKIVRIQFTLKDRFYVQRATGVCTIFINKLFIVSDLAELKTIIDVYIDARNGKYSQ